MAITTLRQLLAEACAETGDNPEALVHFEVDEYLDRRFDQRYGEGKSIRAWSERYVYFDESHAGAVWIRWVPRDPERED